MWRESSIADSRPGRLSSSGPRALPVVCDYSSRFTTASFQQDQISGVTGVAAVNH